MRGFTFSSSWVVAADPAAVHAVLADVEHYPDWWPQVVACLKTGEDAGVVLCRSTLPYTLELHLALALRTPRVLESRLSGDLDGWVRWTVEPAPGGCRIGFEQEVEVTGLPLRIASYAARPALRWNHARMLAGARSGLAERMARIDGGLA